MSQFQAPEHKDPRDSQLLVALTGTPSEIRYALRKMINEIDEYGKPMQGTVISHNVVSEVITPIWNQKPY